MLYLEIASRQCKMYVHDTDTMGVYDYVLFARGSCENKARTELCGLH